MDMTQEVYIACLRRPIGFPDDARAGAWLKRVATNKSFNEIRRRKYRLTSTLDEDSTDSGNNPFPFLEDQILFQEILSGFPKRKVGIIISYFLEGMTLSETAAAESCSVPTVRRALASFAEMARQRLSDEGEA